MLNVAICDDENIVSGEMDGIINELCYAEGINVDIEVFCSGGAFIKEILAGKRFDLIFMDIQMKNGDGINAATEVRKVDENAVIIFVSGYPKYAISLFGLDVFAFVLKPLVRDEIESVFRKAYRKIGVKNYYFTFRYRNFEHKVLYRDILYFESRGRQVIIHVKNGNSMCFNSKLADVEKKTANGKNSFLRVHQSFLVNYHWIRKRSKKEVVLITGEKLPISEERHKAFSVEYGRLLGEDIDV